jgi:hypothetical protein
VAVIFDVGEQAEKAADRAVELIRDSRGFDEGSVEAWPVRLPLPHEGDDLGDWFCKYGRTGDELMQLIRTARP